jgi:hypothetical protein
MHLICAYAVRIQPSRGVGAESVAAASQKAAGAAVPACSMVRFLHCAVHVLLPAKLLASGTPFAAIAVSAGVTFWRRPLPIRADSYECHARSDFATGADRILRKE